MTVTIIGPVTDFYVNCFDCGLKLQYKLHDVQLRMVLNENLDVKFREYYINCPSCKRAIRVGQ